MTSIDVLYDRDGNDGATKLQSRIWFSVGTLHFDRGIVDVLPLS